MPTILHRDLVAALNAVDALQHGRLLKAATDSAAPVREKPLKLAPLTGVKLSRIRRALLAAHTDYEEQRQAVLKRHARLGEDGAVETGAGGAVQFPAPDAEAECRRELTELDRGAVEVAETLRLADFRRRERDDFGKVVEVDEVEPWMIDGLFDLIVMDPAEAAP